MNLPYTAWLPILAFTLICGGCQSGPEQAALQEEGDLLELYAAQLPPEVPLELVAQHEWEQQANPRALFHAGTTFGAHFDKTMGEFENWGSRTEDRVDESLDTSVRRFLPQGDIALGEGKVFFHKFSF